MSKPREYRRCDCGSLVKVILPATCQGCERVYPRERKWKRRANVLRTQLTHPAVRFDPMEARLRWAGAVTR